MVRVEKSFSEESVEDELDELLLVKEEHTPGILLNELNAESEGVPLLDGSDES